MSASERTKPLIVSIATVIAHMKSFHPKDTRTNDLLGKTVWRAAFRHDPASKKLGRKPSIFNGYGGLPKTSEVLELSPETLAHVFKLAEEGFIFPV